MRESILGRWGSASGPRAPLLSPAPKVPGARLGQAGEGRAHSGILCALEDALGWAIKASAPCSASLGR